MPPPPQLSGRNQSPPKKITQTGPKRPGGRVFKEPIQYMSAFAGRQFEHDLFRLAIPFSAKRPIVDSHRSAGRVRYGWMSQSLPARNGVYPSCCSIFRELRED